MERRTERGWSTDWAHVIPTVLALRGTPLCTGSDILDFGCGDGRLVVALKARGYRASGADFLPQLSPLSDDCHPIDESHYRLPFADSTFDAVVSLAVFEHVMNYDEALREIARVLRPNGSTLHIFPSRYSLREPHTSVPFATIIQKLWWFSLWAKIGIRNEFQNDMSTREIALKNFAFIETQTKYPSRNYVRRAFERSFMKVDFAEQEVLLAKSAKTRILSKIPFFHCFVSEAKARVVYAALPKGHSCW